MQIKRGKITLKNLQLKSKEKIERLSYALNIIEEECGIHEVEIKFQNIFVCPWIDLDTINKTPMEELVVDVLKQIN